MAAEGEWQILQFQPWNSSPDVSFWQKLSSLKLDKFQLDDQAQKLTGYFAPGRSVDVPARFTIDDSAFAALHEARNMTRARYDWQAPGILYNTNTLAAFKTLDKSRLLRQAAAPIFELVEPHDKTNDVVTIDQLNSFVLVTFADLKHHCFLYWFGFPALTPLTSFQARVPPLPISSVLSSAEQLAALRGLLQLRHVDPVTHQVLRPFPPFFVLERVNPSASSGPSVRILDVLTWQQTAASSRLDVLETLFGFVDPCPLKTHPGWPLRNFLAYLTASSALIDGSSQTIRILSFREHVHHFTDVPQDFQWTKSLVFQVRFQEPFWTNERSRQTIRVVGWEVNRRGKCGPRQVELSQLLDPIRLAETSMDLNLKLMRWRQVPSLDLALLARTKCLLLGAGTLGCYLARSLLAWGVRHMTLVDHSTVTHSNPVRQPLYEFQDVGKLKTECAVNALKRIFPLVQAHAVNLTIPMAGHALSSPHLLQEARQALETLEQLIETHDVVFLATDSRESRWLPTVLAAAKRKLLLNAALGFDSYLVMRHGVPRESDDHPQAPLGCYFCNDIVSPRDSLKDRTLDQMCTVTRPGLAPIAAATAVELLVAVLHSPEGKFVRATKPSDDTVPLKYVPHQLRGFLNAFQHLVITGEAFDKCIACSPNVLNAYATDRFELLTNACNSTTYLEELTGLNELTEQAEALMIDLEDSDGDGDMV